MATTSAANSSNALSSNRTEPSPPALARWPAAVLCILYGFAKINGSQFSVLDSELARPMGEVSGFWLTWHFFGYSTVYGTILALVQIGAGILLVVPRTALAGALLLLPVVTNILLIDIFYGVDLGGTIAALALCVCVVITIKPHLRRLSEAVLLNTKPRRPASGALTALTLVIGGSFAFTWWVANYNNRVPTPIDGVWAVAAQVDTTADTPQWQQVFFERNRAYLVVFRSAGHPDQRHHFEIDAEGGVSIWEVWLTKGALIMRGRRRSEAQMELELSSQMGGGRIVLQRVRPAL